MQAVLALWGWDQGTCITCSNPFSRNLPHSSHSSRRRQIHTRRCCCRRHNCHHPCIVRDHMQAVLALWGWDQGTCITCSNPFSRNRPHSSHSSRRRQIHTRRCCCRRRSCHRPCTVFDHMPPLLALWGWDQGTCIPCSNPFSRNRPPHSSRSNRPRRNHSPRCCCCRR